MAMKKKAMKKEKMKEKEEEEMKGKEGVMLLPAYMRMWALATFVRVTTSTGTELRYNNAVAVAVLATLCVPLVPVALLGGLCVRIAAMFASLPYLHDSQHWCLQTDVALLVAVVAALSRRPSRDVLLKRFTRDEAARIMTHTTALVRIQLILFYTAAALYKFNEGFMHPRFSCAPVYLIQLLDANLPRAMLDPRLVALVTAAAPTLILLVEAVIPVLIVLDPRVGAAFAAIFHWAIAITPPPNAVASFGVQTLPRVLLLIPDPSAAAKALTSFSLAPGSWRGFVVIATAAMTSALQPATWGGPIDFMHSTTITVPLCGAYAAIVCVAAATSFSAKHAPVHGRLGFAGIALCVWGVFYGFGMITLGVGDMGTANMFSSLRMHGGSSHYFLPTNLLQEAYTELTPDTAVGEAFGGGIVRIEATNSSYISGPGGLRYPGEIWGHTSSSLEILVETGHSGRQWSPMSYACAIGNHPVIDNTETNHGLGKNHTGLEGNYRTAAGEDAFDMFSLPAPEVRRVVREARERHPREDFDIVGATLPGATGDETWRANAVRTRFVLRRRFDAVGKETLTCTDPHTDEVCDVWTHAVLLAPPTNRWLNVLMRTILVQQPYPILAEDAGEHRRVHCFGP